MFKAKDIMTSNVITVNNNTPIYDAIRILVRADITSLFVLNNDMKLIGVLSEKDVIKLLFNLEDHAGCVKEFMTTDVKAFDKEESLMDICDCFINNNFRRVPIMHDDNIVGVICRRDIIQYILHLRHKDD